MSSADESVTEQPLLMHLIELRNRMLYMVAAVLVIFLALFVFSNDIYHIVARPLLHQLPEGASMISTKPAGTFFTPVKLVLVLSIFVAMPYILYQVWSFIAPGLYAHERRLIMPLMISSTLLFYAGMAFAYFVVFPLMFRFFVMVAPDGVKVMTDITEYLDFVLKIFFAFGVAFEVPIFTILLVWTEITTPESLVEKRPYIIVIAFVVGMLLTPPDVISQTLLAVPMWGLFEAGLVASRYFLRMKREREAEEEREYAAAYADPAPASAAESTESMDETLDRYIHDEEQLNAEQQAIEPDEGGPATPDAPENKDGDK